MKSSTIGQTENKPIRRTRKDLREFYGAPGSYAEKNHQRLLGNRAAKVSDIPKYHG